MEIWIYIKAMLPFEDWIHYHLLPWYFLCKSNVHFNFLNSFCCEMMSLGIDVICDYWNCLKHLFNTYFKNIINSYFQEICSFKFKYYYLGLNIFVNLMNFKMKTLYCVKDFFSIFSNFIHWLDHFKQIDAEY